jgi:thymidylate synthase ThyX
MPVGAKVVLDSIGPQGVRLITTEVTHHRFVHSEFMTHCMFARNASSSRAIPFEKALARIEADPAMPVYWGMNQKGMSAEVELQGEEREKMERQWHAIIDDMVLKAKIVAGSGLHKQLVNRLLEFCSYITVVVTGTSDAYANYFSLRCTKFAQPEIKVQAEALREVVFASTPNTLHEYEWHTPYIQEDEKEKPWTDLVKLSIARCARVSYLTQNGVRDPEEDFRLHDQLKENGHWSPFDHVAQAYPRNVNPHYGNGKFKGWMPYRRLFPQEYVRNYTWNGLTI